MGHDLRIALGTHPTQQRPLNIVSGYVSTEQPAPTSLADPAYVIVPGHTTEAGVPMAFGALHGATIPAPGAACLVAYDENRLPTVIWWAGTYTAP